MSRNLIQFQPGLSLPEFIQRYGTQAQCESALEASRWPSGFHCPHCRDTRHSSHYRSGRKLFQCYRCRKQTSLTAGTIFDATKLSLTIWFLAMHLLTQAKNNVSALELSRHLGVSYNTAWLIKHKLLQVMEEREQNRELIGRVEIDDAYLGGEHRGKRGRGSPNKVPFIAAVQTNDEGHPQLVRFDCVNGFTHDEIERWAQQALSASTVAHSDGLRGFTILSDMVNDHIPAITGSGSAAVQHPQFKWVNTLLANLKTAITGTYHAIKFKKYAQRYLSEAQYRFNRRFDLSSILVRLLHAAVTTKPKTLQVTRLAEICT
jgi:ribosomal protein L37AE/L43A